MPPAWMNNICETVHARAFYALIRSVAIRLSCWNADLQTTLRNRNADAGPPLITFRLGSFG
jgi:hypothetical protein